MKQRVVFNASHLGTPIVFRARIVRASREERGIHAASTNEVLKVGNLLTRWDEERSSGVNDALGCGWKWVRDGMPRKAREITAAEHRRPTKVGLNCRSTDFSRKAKPHPLSTGPAALRAQSGRLTAEIVLRHPIA